MRLRGEICIGAATFLSFVSVLLLIFAHVGQINTSSVPRSLSMVKVNISGYGNALQSATGDPVDNLYAQNTSVELGDGEGLRQLYEFGLYSFCAYINITGDMQGNCSNHTTAQRFEPYTIALADMPTRFSDLTKSFIPQDLTFTNSRYLGEFSHSAYYFLLLGTICAALAMFTGIPKRTYTFLISTLFAIVGTGLLFIGCVIWTVIINKAKSINGAMVTNTSSNVSTPLGISVSAGSSLSLFWASFVCLFLSIIPYLVSCCTYRG